MTLDALAVSKFIQARLTGSLTTWRWEYPVESSAVQVPNLPVLSVFDVTTSSRHL